MTRFLLSSFTFAHGGVHPPPPTDTSDSWLSGDARAVVLILVIAISVGPLVGAVRTISIRRNSRAKGEGYAGNQGSGSIRAYYEDGR